MRQLVKYLYVIIILVACERNDESLRGNSIDSKVAIEIREVLEQTSRRVTFLCKTERIYPCVNFPILANKAEGEKSLTITFTSVDQTGHCLTATGPATAWIDAGTLANGEYDIELNNGSLGNQGTLVVTDIDLQLHFPDQRGISIVRETTRRIPDKTYWGVIGYHAESSAAIVDSFIQKFKDLGADFNNQVPGHYFYYEIDSSGKRVYDVSKSGYWFARPFVFQFNGDETALKNVIRIESNDYKTELSISAENYRGEQINNWSK